MKDALHGLLTFLVFSGLAVALAYGCRSATVFEEYPTPHELLPEGVLLVTRYDVADPKSHPTPSYVVRAGDDDIVLHAVDDLRPQLLPIDTPRLAKMYVYLLRYLRLAGSPPGIGHASPSQGGLGFDFDEQALALGATERSFAETDTGIEIREPALVADASGGMRLVDLRLHVTPDGAITSEELREIARDAATRSLMFGGR